MYYFISFLVFIISICLFNKASGSLSLTRFNMISWIFYIQLFAMSFLGSVLVVNNIDNHYAIHRIGEDARVGGWLAVQYTMIAFPIGMMLANFISEYRKVKNLQLKYFSKSVCPSISTHDSYIRYPLYFVSVICVFAVIYTYFCLKQIPILSSLFGLDSESLALLRQQAQREFTGNVYVRNILALTLTPIISYIAYCYWKMTSKKTDFCWFLVMCFFSISILIYNLEKAPVIFYLIGFIFITVNINGKISGIKLFLIFSLLILLLTSLYLITKNGASLSNQISLCYSILKRIFLSQAAGTYFSFQYYPSIFEHIGFNSISSFVSNIFHLVDHERSARIIMITYNTKGAEAGVVGVMNSLFIAEAWANFGLIGVIIAPLYVGAFVQFIYLYFLRSNKTPLLIGLYAYISYKLPITGGINDFIYNAGLVMTVFIFFCIYLSGLSLKLSRHTK